MPAMQSGLALQCRRHKGKKGKARGRCAEETGEELRLDTGEERSRGGGEKVKGRQRREDERRREGTGYAVSLKSLRGSGGRGRDERRG